MNYSGYPVKITGDEIANYGYIKLNGRPVTDAADTAENAGIGVYWTTASQLQIVIPSGNELLDFTKQLTISIEKEFRTILNAGSNGVFEQTLQKYSERDGMWKEVFSDDGLLFDTNMDLKVTGVGSYTDEGENVSFAITFNQDIAYGYFPHANSTATFMSSMLQQFYTQNEIKYFVYNGLGDSIRDNIILDGKSIWERMEVEGPIMNQHIMLHYGNDGKNMYILIECAEEITPYTDDCWLNILLRTGNSEYTINKQGLGVLSSETESVICENVLQGNRFWIKIPFANLKDKGKTCALRVMDHVGEGVLGIYSQGDSAPLGNLFYEYKFD